MKKTIFAVAMMVLAAFVGVGYALLTQYASTSATAAVNQSLVSADDGVALTAVWNGDNTSTVINSGETANIFFDVNNRNREVAISSVITGNFSTPDNDGLNIVSVSLNNVSCTYTSGNSSFTCAAQSQPSLTQNDWFVQFVTDVAAPAGTYTANVNVLPA